MLPFPMTIRRCLPLMIWVGALSLSGCGSGSNNAAPDPNADTVSTQYGAVKGTVSAGGRAFLGIPFAAPPVGDLRWKAPQAPTPWTSARDATQFGPRCPQFATPIGNAGGDNEDCLYLNVFTPAQSADNGPLPVMLWLHGGSWVIGSGSDYPGDVLANAGKVIVVTTNYRLGPFGYLALQGLASEDPHGSTGDYGMLDQLAALQWVHDNIGPFGGDAANVTLFGESAGGISTCQLMASPLAKGLFQKAIIESGPCLTPMVSLKDAEKYGKSFIQRAALGCTSLSASAQVSCMRGKSTDEILGAETALEQQAIAGSFGPALDGYVMPESPESAIADGSFAQIPVINGSNHDEGKLFVALMYDLALPPAALDADNYADQLGQGLIDFDSSLAPIVPLITPLIVNEYPLSGYSTPPGFDPYYVPAHDAVAGVFTDSLFACGGDKSDAAFAGRGQTVYAYEFADPSPPIPYSDPYIAPPMAGHAGELVYVFQAPIEGGAVSPSQFSADQLALSTQMQQYWTHFARTGDPNGDGLPVWPAFTPSAGQLLTLAPGSGGVATLSESDFKSAHRCAFWSLFSL